MKRNDIQELKSRSRGELEKLLAESREALWALKFQLAAGKVKNVGELKELKKKITRILTFLHTQHEDTG